MAPIATSRPSRWHIILSIRYFIVARQSTHSYRLHHGDMADLFVSTRNGVVGVGVARRRRGGEEEIGLLVEDSGWEKQQYDGNNNDR
jgi:hypothetical protein